MTKIYTGWLAALIVLAALAIAPAASAAASTRDAYGKQAAVVAGWGGCKNVRVRSNGGDFAYSGLVCDLRGERINILTFTKKREELRWISTTCRYLPSQWIMVGVGFVITAKNGNEGAARVGHRVYDGLAVRCSDVGD